MIQCGDYNWEILKENDGSEVYRLVISNRNETLPDILLMYGDGIFSIRNFNRGEYDIDYFCFKMPFEDTGIMVERLINGEGGYLMPIYHKETVLELI